MPGEFPFSVGEYRHFLSVIATVPAGGSETMAVHGTNFGRPAPGSSSAPFYFSGGLVGKTVIITDNRASVTSAKEIKFLSSHFADGDRPTLAEIVAALNATLDDDVAPTVASAGAQGQLIISGASANATASLTIGAGTANILLGLPKSGVYIVVLNGTGISIVFPAGMEREYLYSKVPRVELYAFTTATGVRTRDTQWSHTWTPSTRTLLLANNGGAARTCQIDVAF